MKSFRSKSEHNPEDPIEEFLAAIKLVSGEEILGKVIVDYSSPEEKVIVDNPLICHEVRSYGANVPMVDQFEPWMKMTDYDTFVIGLEKINNDNKKVVMKIHKETGDVIDVELDVRLDVPEEVIFWKNGGILPTAFKEA